MVDLTLLGLIIIIPLGKSSEGLQLRLHHPWYSTFIWDEYACIQAPLTWLPPSSDLNCLLVSYSHLHVYSDLYIQLIAFLSYWASATLLWWPTYTLYVTCVQLLSFQHELLKGTHCTTCFTQWQWPRFILMKNSIIKEPCTSMPCKMKKPLHCVTSGNKFWRVLNSYQWQNVQKF